MASARTPEHSTQHCYSLGSRPARLVHPDLIVGCRNSSAHLDPRVSNCHIHPDPSCASTCHSDPKASFMCCLDPRALFMLVTLVQI
ncbi:unnamed protein product [Citrullus colocynthis]|uniref:Uncharacterized protein n=1 Tax=Citrullus colocynthis TaxID=252529 RepID=A0ABP0YX55_9ROSI